MVTLFSFGYWGWGSETKRLVEAVDAAEKARGFKAPLFVDIRLRREVRAQGFSGIAFATLVGKDRYRWMSGLGNRSIATHESRIVIDKPGDAAELLKLTLDCHKQKRRILFFCSCADLDVLVCHRHVVTDLLLKEARRQGRKIAIVEWPGGEPVSREVRVSALVFKAVERGRKTLPLPLESSQIGELASLPWGSILTIRSGKTSLKIVTGPAKYGKAWNLPVLELAPMGTSNKALVVSAKRFRRDNGLEPNQTTRKVRS